MRLVDPDRYAALKATGKLPSPKGVALSIIRLLQRDDFRIGDLVRLVQSDPAIAGRILYFANAAAFGLMGGLLILAIPPFLFVLRKTAEDTRRA